MKPSPPSTPILDLVDIFADWIVAEQLVEHLKAMLAERAEIPVGEYVVIVERRTERRADG